MVGDTKKVPDLSGEQAGWLKFNQDKDCIKPEVFCIFFSRQDSLAKMKFIFQNEKGFLSAHRLLFFCIKWLSRCPAIRLFSF